MSFPEFFTPKLNRKVEIFCSSVRDIASKTNDGFTSPDPQAAPFAT